MDLELQQLLKQIDIYIEESQDANFDRYLEQMKQILLTEPSRLEEIREAVARNMNRYRENVKKQQKASVEFKIGAGVLSGIGILFVLVATVILVRNFLPQFVQGMLMFAFFALVWVVSQLGIVRVSQKMATGLTGASIIGLYISVMVNYHVFDTLPPYWAQGILVLIAVLSWLNGFFTGSAVIQCMSFGGYLIFFMFLPWNAGVPEFVLLLITMAGLNLMWNLGAAGENKEWVRLIHMLCCGVFLLGYGIFLLIDLPGDSLTLVFIYGILMTGLLNFFYVRSEGMGAFAAWICCGVFQTAFLAGLVIAMQFREEFIQSQLLLVLAALNLLLLLWKKFQWHSMGLYYQVFFLLLFLVEGQWIWPGIVAALVLFALGVCMIREKLLSHELTMSIYFFVFIGIVVPSLWVAPVELAYLLGFTLLCLYVPKLRSRREAALVYTNVSLIGVMLLGLWVDRLSMEPNYIADTIVLVLAILTVLLLWRKRCHMPEQIQGLILGLVLTYMIFVYRIQLPVVVSIALMVVAVGAILAGFIRNEVALRIYGLALSLFVCAKVVVYDYWDLELLPKSILLLVVGLIAIGISIIYAVLEHSQRKKFRNKKKYMEPEAIPENIGQQINAESGNMWQQINAEPGKMEQQINAEPEIESENMGQQMEDAPEETVAEESGPVCELQNEVGKRQEEDETTDSNTGDLES